MPSAKLEVQLTLSDRLKAGFTKASKEVKTFATRTRNAIRRINKSVLGLQGAVGALGAALTVGGIFRLTKSVAESADQIGKLSQRLGLSTEFISEFRFVAGQTGVESNVLDLALQRITRRFGEIARTGKGTALPALKELGSDLVSAVKRGVGLEKLLPLIADRLNSVDDAAKRTSIAMQLFDSEGVKLVQTLGLGSRGIQDLRDEAQKLGLTISGKAAADAAAFNDEIDKLKKTFVGFTNEAILPLLPELEKFSKFLRGVIKDIRDTTPALSILLDREISVTTKLALLAALRKKTQLDLGAAIVAGLTPSGKPRAAEPGAGGPPRNSVQDFFNQQGGREADRKNRQISALRLSQKQLGEDLQNLVNPELRDQVDAFNDINSASKGARAGITDMKIQFAGFNVARQAVNAVGDSLVNNISENLSAIVDGTKSAKEAFRDMAKSILQDLQRIIIRALIARAVGAVLGPAPAVAGGVASFASGGFVPPGRTQRAVLHGPEVIVPLNRQFNASGIGGGGGGGSTVINIQAIDVADFDAKIAQSMKRQDTTLSGIVAGAARSNQGLRTSFSNI